MGATTSMIAGMSNLASSATLQTSDKTMVAHTAKEGTETMQVLPMGAHTAKDEMEKKPAVTTTADQDSQPHNVQSSDEDVDQMSFHQDFEIEMLLDDILIATKGSVSIASVVEVFESEGGKFEELVAYFQSQGFAKKYLVAPDSKMLAWKGCI